MCSHFLSRRCFCVLLVPCHAFYTKHKKEPGHHPLSSHKLATADRFFTVHTQLAIPSHLLSPFVVPVVVKLVVPKHCFALARASLSEAGASLSGAGASLSGAGNLLSGAGTLFVLVSWVMAGIVFAVAEDFPVGADVLLVVAQFFGWWLMCCRWWWRCFWRSLGLFCWCPVLHWGSVRLQMWSLGFCWLLLGLGLRYLRRWLRFLWLGRCLRFRWCPGFVDGG